MKEDRGGENVKIVEEKERKMERERERKSVYNDGESYLQFLPSTN